MHLRLLHFQIGLPRAKLFAKHAACTTVILSGLMTLLWCTAFSLTKWNNLAPCSFKRFTISHGVYHVTYLPTLHTFSLHKCEIVMIKVFPFVRLALIIASVKNAFRNIYHHFGASYLSAFVFKYLGQIKVRTIWTDYALCWKWVPYFVCL